MYVGLYPPRGEAKSSRMLSSMHAVSKESTEKNGGCVENCSVQNIKKLKEMLNCQYDWFSGFLKREQIREVIQCIGKYEEAYYICSCVENCSVQNENQKSR
jgi:hypothetical protein